METSKFRNKIESKNQSPEAAGETVEILYQKLGSRWFAFSMINDEVFVGSIDDGELNDKNKSVKTPLFKFPSRSS